MKGKHIKIFVFISLILLLNGCIYSLHSIVSEDVLVENNYIVGRWSGKENTSWDFKPYMDEDKKDLPNNGVGMYKLTYDQKGIAYDFLVGLVKLGENYYLDIYPIDGPDLENDLLSQTIIASHLFYKIEINKGRLKIWAFKHSWLDTLFNESRIRLAHETTDEGIVLTASTEDLQQFMIKYGDLPEAYDTPTELLPQPEP